MKPTLMAYSRCALLALGATTLLASSHAHSAGFEKSVIWSGHWAPLGGAAAGAVTGAESLFFNPAGLGGGKGIEVSANFSPIFGQFSGPLTTPNTSVDSSRKLSPAFGALASYNPVENWGFGIGAFVSGGTKAIYEGVTFAPTFNTTADIKADLSVVEFSAGTGYEIFDGLRVGAAYRVVKVGANLSSARAPTPPSTTLSVLSLSDLSATRYNGVRLGIQYAPREGRWGVGATWRNEVNFTATGDGVVQLTGAGAPAGTTVSLPVTGGSVSNTFPQAVDVGGFFALTPKQRAFLQYTFQEYHKNQKLDIGGSFTSPLAPTVPQPLPTIPQNWLNVHVLRLGYEFAELDNWALRGGYVLTSKATPTSDARPTFSSPGFGHTLALGVGTRLFELVECNGGLEYSFASGTVGADTPRTTGVLPGDYKTNSFAAHLGLTYRM